MKSEQLQTAALVAVAMLLGAGAMYFFGKSEKQSIPVAAIAAPAVIAPAPEKSPVAQFSMQFDSELDAAVSAAKAERAAGTLKALATTPDEFARALGKINFRLHDFTARYEQPPATDDTAFTEYSTELKQLTADLANLLSDESLMAQVEDGDPGRNRRPRNDAGRGSRVRQEIRRADRRHRSTNPPAAKRRTTQAPRSARARASAVRPIRRVNAQRSESAFSIARFRRTQRA
jgi:hypothetical protein